jgi:hypothetical protein
MPANAKLRSAAPPHTLIGTAVASLERRTTASVVTFAGPIVFELESASRMLAPGVWPDGHLKRGSPLLPRSSCSVSSLDQLRRVAVPDPERVILAGGSDPAADRGGGGDDGPVVPERRSGAAGGVPQDQDSVGPSDRERGASPKTGLPS